MAKIFKYLSEALVDFVKQEISTPTKPKQSPKAGPRMAPRWIEPGEKVVVAGRKIGGMIYLGLQSRQDTSWNREGGAFIDPGLPVAKIGSDFSGASMPYWPSYSDINPQERATYLDWLAGERSDRKFGPGYIFLYFYGLERRFFVDNPTEEEKNVIIVEVQRILDIYGGNRSIGRYLKIFLDTAQVVLDPTGNTEPRPEKSGYELPLSLRVAIGLTLKNKQSLDADQLLGWYISYPETILRTPATRAFLEFRTLFTLLFNERFPEGLTIQIPKRLLHACYSSAAGTFEAELQFENIPDISGISVPLAVAQEIAEEATKSLEKYSRFLGRNPDAKADTIEAHALLPKRLWPLFPCPEIENLRQWAEKIIDSDGFVLVNDVIEQLEGASADLDKISKRQLTGAADALARLSIGMAPDPRFALRSPKSGEPVVLFRLPEGITALEEVSDIYKNILIAIALGSFVAHADGVVADRERRALENRINAANLSREECLRLLANLQWMLTVQPDIALLRRRLKDISENIRHELGQLVLAMAAVDGVIDPMEIKAIKKLYKAIDLPGDSVYSDLHALTARSEPVVVRPADKQVQDFAIPPPPNQDNKVVLDSNRIATLMADTARVSSLLGDIFHDDDSEAQEDFEENLENISNGFPGLDVKHAAFLNELLMRPHWSKFEFSTLSKQFKLMESGALETINEWSFEYFGDVLIEEYEDYELNPEIVEQCNSDGSEHF